MQTLIITKGLPASGKTSWAKKVILDAPANFIKRVNKDELRAMMDAGRWSPGSEKLVKEAEELIVKSCLTHGKIVIVDDTNFEYEEHWRKVAQDFKVNFRVEDFKDVPVQTCIERDKARANPVGSDVILRMAKRYGLIPSAPAYIKGAPSAVICDIDGTVAVMNGRGPYDLNVENDLPRREVINAVKGVLGRSPLATSRLIFVSGRKEAASVATADWLKQIAWFDTFTLLMRKDDDNRRDSIVKREIYDQHIAGKYNVVAVFDDRPQVINEVWRPLGLPVFDVGPGVDF